MAERGGEEGMKEQMKQVQQMRQMDMMDWLSDFQLNLLEDCRFKGTVLGFRLVSDFTEWLRVWGMLVWGNIVLGLAKWPDDQPGQLSSLGTGVISEAAGEIGNMLLHQWIALGGWVRQLWVHSFVTKFFNIFIYSIYIYKYPLNLISLTLILIPISILWRACQTTWLCCVIDS